MSAASLRARTVDSDSESDDDVPLSMLRAPAVKTEAAAIVKLEVKPEVKAEVKTEVKTEVKSEVKTEVKSEVKTEVSNGSGRKHKAVESGSDDDIPISGLAQRKKMKVEASVKSGAVPGRTSTPTHPSPRTPRKAKKRVIKVKIRQQECTEKLYETLKGRLTQELLCRWWYALEWPPVKKHPHKMHGVQELDGFPGAYIRVKGDDMGSIEDTRLPVGKPSFLHFFTMPSGDLQKLLLQAYDKQMEVLVEHEGSDTPLLKELQKARASAARINVDKADRAVRKVLKEFSELEREMKEVEAQVLAAKEENTPTEEEEDDDDDDDDDDDELDTADDD